MNGEARTLSGWKTLSAGAVYGLLVAGVWAAVATQFRAYIFSSLDYEWKCRLYVQAALLALPLSSAMSGPWLFRLSGLARGVLASSCFGTLVCIEYETFTGQLKFGDGREIVNPVLLLGLVSIITSITIGLIAAGSTQRRRLAGMILYPLIFLSAVSLGLIGLYLSANTGSKYTDSWQAVLGLINSSRWLLASLSILGLASTPPRIYVANEPGSEQ